MSAIRGNVGGRPARRPKSALTKFDKMSESEKIAIHEEQLHGRKQEAKKLFEKWRKRVDANGQKYIGCDIEKMWESNRAKAENAVIWTDNMAKALQSSRLNEAQLSTNFQTTPENVVRMVSIGYDNSCRGEVFDEIALSTMRDSIYYVSPVYSKTNRDATAGDVTHESTAYRTDTEEEIDLVDGTGAGTAYSGTLSVAPIVPFKTNVLVNDVVVAVDNGSGVFIGDALDTASANTINYTTGAYVLNFLSAPNAQIDILSYYNSEEETLYDELQDVELQIRQEQFIPRPMPLGITWSNMSQFLLDSTLGIDSGNTLTSAAGDEIQKAKDYIAFREGYREAKKKATFITWDADWALAGASTEEGYLRTAPKMFRDAGNLTYADLKRGAMPTSVYGGAGAISYVGNLPNFVYETKVNPQGIFKVGTMNGITFYQVPSEIVPDDELVTVYKNTRTPNDVAMSIGSYLPLASTMMLEHKNMYKEFAMYAVEDRLMLQGKYIQRIKIINL